VHTTSVTSAQERRPETTPRTRPKPDAWRHHPGIAYPLIRDAPLARFALVWRTAAETDLLRTFASVVTELGPIALWRRLGPPTPETLMC
jgi:hypothetical protein